MGKPRMGMTLTECSREQVFVEPSLTGMAHKYL
jgi:hypothetical protein